jgi:hypothetical protein
VRAGHRAPAPRRHCGVRASVSWVHAAGVVELASAAEIDNVMGTAPALLIAFLPRLCGTLCRSAASFPDFSSSACRGLLPAFRVEKCSRRLRRGHPDLVDRATTLRR